MDGNGSCQQSRSEPSLGGNIEAIKGKHGPFLLPPRDIIMITRFIATDIKPWARQRVASHSRDRPTYSSGHLNGKAAWAWIDLQELTSKGRCVVDSYDLAIMALTPGLESIGQKVGYYQ